MIHSLPRFSFFLLSCLFFFSISQSKAQGINLPTAGTYTQTFDNINAGLPDGWTVRTGASSYPTLLGSTESLRTTPTQWNDVTSGFSNVASSDGLSATASVIMQNASTDRALAIRQSDTFGNPGAAFTFQLAHTRGASNLKLKFKAQSLDASASKTTTWRVEYGLGETPSVYIDMGQSFSTGGNNFFSKEIEVNFGSLLNNNLGPVRIRIIANSPSTGSGRAALTAIDDLTLSYSTTPTISYNRLNTMSYAQGQGPAVEELIVEGYHLAAGPGQITVRSQYPGEFKVSGDGVSYGSSTTVSYADGNAFTKSVKVRFDAGLSKGRYPVVLVIEIGDYTAFVFGDGLVTEVPNQPFTTTATPEVSFVNYVGFDDKIGFIRLVSANLTTPGAYTITSTNPSAFQVYDQYGQKSSQVTRDYNGSNPPGDNIQLAMIKGLGVGEYKGTLRIEGGNAPAISVPISGTVLLNTNPPVITTSPTSLAPFATTLGSPSSIQSFTVSGRNFDSRSGQVNIVCPPGFEVSIGPSPFSPNPAFAIGVDFDYEIQVRMTGNDIGSFGGDIRLTNSSGSRATVTVNGTVESTNSRPLSVTALSYNCTTGALTFGRTGGDVNRAVEYMAVGVKSYSTNPNGIIDLAKRNDPNSGTIVTLKARYVGDPASEVSRDFNFGAYCSTPQPPTTDFAITGVNTVSCQTVNGGERRLTFTPQYSGLTGPVSFSVVNEMLPTLSAGPYTLRVYTDNPIITLSAQQGSAVARYSYNWLAVCNSPARLSSEESTSRLAVKVLGNPVVGQSAEVEISGVSGQSVQLKLVDLQGKTLHGQSIEKAGSVERVSLPLGNAQGILLLDVSTATQRQQIKLLRP
ncbi:hypothetical protein M0L20_01175 [Spirosoma sp. RP8]|uniref:T9SS type A sorting domain-containing protein n=1 Tax=Spirosoma liriopis TaxID=2937440 RepID=A0ABT0HE60_9BACT|nr:hypothetical protein [Spirosoma liriopis]MCK8490440.1 hypothetical protein [Spirosoma liriopis]